MATFRSHATSLVGVTIWIVSSLPAWTIRRLPFLLLQRGGVLLDIVFFLDVEKMKYVGRPHETTQNRSQLGPSIG
ncbi:hypothetical protein ACOSP7_011147 [Xanthoceras sorbifolium]